MSVIKHCLKRRQEQEDLVEPAKRMRRAVSEPGTTANVETECESETTTASTASTDNSSTSSSRSSTSKQAASFSKQWLKGREQWLQYVEGRGMFCVLCRKYKKTSFGHDIWSTTPCSRLRLQSITTHENSSAHKDSVKLELNCQQSQDITMVSPPIPRKGGIQLFVFLAKQRIPHTTNYKPLLNLLEALGLTTKSDLNVTKNVTYTSDKAIQEMMYILSEVIEQNTIKQESQIILL